MAMREWLAGVLESVGLHGLGHQVLPLTPEEIQSRRMATIEDEVQRAVENALAGWRPPTGEDVRIDHVYVVDSEHGNLVGQDLWIDLDFAGEGAQIIPEHYFLRLAPPVDRPGPDATPEQRAAYAEYLADPDRNEPVPAPLAPATMAWLEDLEQRTLAAVARARPRTRVHVTFGGLLPDPEAEEEDAPSPASGRTDASAPPADGLHYYALLPAGLVCIALGLFQLAPGCRAHLEDSRFREEGVVVQGTVTGKRSSKRTKTVEYRFVTDANRVVVGSGRMDLSDWIDVQVGGPVTVTYLRSRPESNHALPRADDGVYIGLAFVVLGLVLLPMAFLPLPAWAASRQTAR